MEFNLDLGISIELMLIISYSLEVEDEYCVVVVVVFGILYSSKWGSLVYYVSAPLNIAFMLGEALKNFLESTAV